MHDNICTHEIQKTNPLGNLTKVWNFQQFSLQHRSDWYTLPKTNMDTQNDGLETGNSL